MRAIATKFGIIYIETLEYDRHNPSMREEEDRIKIFDSREEYMDYWSMEILYDQVESENKTLEEVYEDIIARYVAADNLDAICPDIRFDTKDVVKLALFMVADGYLEVDKNKLADMVLNNDLNALDKLVLSNEWVNKVGDNYLLIEEY